MCTVYQALYNLSHTKLATLMLLYSFYTQETEIQKGLVKLVKATY